MKLNMTPVQAFELYILLRGVNFKRDYDVKYDECEPEAVAERSLIELRTQLRTMILTQLESPLVDRFFAQQSEKIAAIASDPPMKKPHKKK